MRKSTIVKMVIEIVCIIYGIYIADWDYVGLGISAFMLTFFKESDYEYEHRNVVIDYGENIK